jgi:FkbM family methyltransferase
LNDARTIQLRRRSGDFFVFHEVFTSLCYDLPERLVPSQPKVIVDLGANIGLTTLFLACRFPAARHICVEPNPFNVAILRQNLSFLEERLDVVEAAVSEQSGRAAFDDTSWTWGGHLVDTGLSTRSVVCTTVDELMTTLGIQTIDILKVDIEGAEKQMFAHRPSWLASVRCVIVELHGDYSVNAFETDIACAGFDVLRPGSQFGNSMIVAVRGGARENRHASHTGS